MTNVHPNTSHGRSAVYQNLGTKSNVSLESHRQYRYTRFLGLHIFSRLETGPGLRLKSR